MMVDFHDRERGSVFVANKISLHPHCVTLSAFCFTCGLDVCVSSFEISHNSQAGSTQNQNLYFSTCAPAQICASRASIFGRGNLPKVASFLLLMHSLDSSRSRL